MKFLANKVFKGIALPVQEMSKLDSELKADYMESVTYIIESGVLKNEGKRIINEAGKSIIRHAATDVEVAWNRGIIHGIEALNMRFLKLEASKKGRFPNKKDETVVK